MRRMNVQGLVALILVGTLTISQAAGPAIGAAMANGSFQVDKLPGLRKHNFIRRLPYPNREDALSGSDSRMARKWVSLAKIQELPSLTSGCLLNKKL